MPPVDLNVVREKLSHMVRERRRERERPSIKVTYPYLDLRLGDDFSLTHPAGPEVPREAPIVLNDPPNYTDAPHPGLYGWGPEDYRKRLIRLRGRTINLNEGDAGVTLLGQTRNGFLCTYWNTLESERSSNISQDGTARLGQGTTETYTRASNAWITDPGSRLVTLIGTNVPPIARNGLRIENFKTNYLFRSSFASGGAGFGAATGTGTVTFEASPPSPLFDASVSNTCMKHTAGNPHTVDLVQAWPVSQVILAGQTVVLSIDHMDDSGANYRWRLQRAIDGRYWNDTTSTWDIGVINNSWTASATRTRDRSKAIPIGGTNTTVTLSVLQLAGGSALRVNRTYHVQLEELTYATSHIVTDAATYARQLQSYGVANDVGKRVWNSAGGSGLCRVRPAWNGADMLASMFPAIFNLVFDGSNRWLLFYNGPTQTLVFNVMVGGVQYNASVPWVPVAETEYQIGWRWASTAGEHGLSPRQMSLFVDGVRSTFEGIRSGNPPDAPTLYIGGDSVGNAFNGNIRQFLLTQEVYSDRQMAAGIA